MKKLAKSAALIFGLAVIMLVSGTAAIAAAPANLGFETGDLTGWTGTGAAVSSLAPNFPAPPSGKFMLSNSGPACASNSVSQVVTLQKDRSISGVAGFQATDYLPFDDSAAVLVNGDAVYSKSISDVGSFGSAPYEKWVFTAPADGDYTVEYVSTNALDCIAAPILLGDSVLSNLTCAALIPTLGLSCALTDAASGAGIAGKTIAFGAGDPNPASNSAVTNAAGVATIDVLTDPVLYVSSVLAGGYSAEFLGDIDANGSSGSAGVA